MLRAPHHAYGSPLLCCAAPKGRQTSRDSCSCMCTHHGLDAVAFAVGVVHGHAVVVNPLVLRAAVGAAVGVQAASRDNAGQLAA
mgnify:CR=1 FL=1